MTSFPHAISNDNRSALLTIDWSDGTRQLLGNRFLRSHCRCAQCKQAQARGDTLVPPTGVLITDIVPIGTYGAQFVFSDGHERGIFPWSYLKDIEAVPAVQRSSKLLPKSTAL